MALPQDPSTDPKMSTQVGRSSSSVMLVTIGDAKLRLDEAVRASKAHAQLHATLIEREAALVEMIERHSAAVSDHTRAIQQLQLRLSMLRKQQDAANEEVMERWNTKQRVEAAALLPAPHHIDINSTPANALTSTALLVCMLQVQTGASSSLFKQRLCMLCDAGHVI